MVRYAKRHPYIFQLLCSFAVGLGIAMFSIFSSLSSDGGGEAMSGEDIAAVLILGPLALSAFSLLCIYPLILLAYQFVLCVRSLRWLSAQSYRPGYDTWVLIFLTLCQILYLVFAKEVIFSAGWQEQLVNSQRHSPIDPNGYIWFFLLAILSLLAFYSLWIKPPTQLPPLIPVLAIGVLYIATIYIALWTIQIFDYQDPTDLYLLIPGIVFVLMVARTIAIAVRTYTVDPDRCITVEENSILARLNRYVIQAKNWPFLSLAIALPLLGVAYAVLILLGQGPHALIKAFIDTSGWTFSQQSSPPNVFYDEHYLCTVAAGGHAQLVKPIRGGIRHGHPIVVNRQLLVANAFEQVISDRLPRIHRMIRHVYDHYGFNLAKRITTRWLADIVWIVMKPLEWVFLIVIYLCVRHPEDLIAMQYTGIHYRELDDLKAMMR